MATQEEVLEAIINNGGHADLRELKRYFKVPYQGSSWLPQRLKSLEKKGLIYPLRVDKMRTIYLANPDLLDIELRGRPAGRFEYKEESIKKLLDFIRREGMVKYWEIRKELGWNHYTTIKYLSKLLKDGLIFKKKDTYLLYNF